MATIVEALKAKNPNATGSTIAEVLMSYNTLDEALAASDNYEGAGSAPLIIDKDLRKVNIPTNYVLGVYNDKDVLNVPFVLPRYYHGLDLSTFDIKINWQNAAGVKNYTEASDIVVGEDVVNFNWLLGAGVFTKAGSVNFVVCVRKATDKGLIEREFNTTTCSATVLEGLEAEDSSDPDQYSILVQMRGYAVDAEYYATQAENSMREAAAYVGSPLKAATAAAMTNTEKVYVYTGSESGYTNGNWYYYDGSAWVSGGVYNSTAVELDIELTSTTKAAQGKKVGDEISALKNDLNETVKITAQDLTEAQKAQARENIGISSSETKSICSGDFKVNDLLFDDETVKSGDTLYYSVIANGLGFVALYDSNDNRIAVMGNISGYFAGVVREGVIVVPDNFSYAKWSGNVGGTVNYIATSMTPDYFEKYYDPVANESHDLIKESVIYSGWIYNAVEEKFNELSIAGVAFYQPVAPGGKIELDYSLQSNRNGHVFFDANLKLVSKFVSIPAVNSKVVLTVPENAYYVCLSFVLSRKDDIHAYYTAPPLKESDASNYNPYERIEVKKYGSYYGSEEYTHCAFPSMRYYNAKTYLMYRCGYKHEAFGAKEYAVIQIDAVGDDGEIEHVKQIKASDFGLNGDARDFHFGLSRDGEYLFAVGGFDLYSDSQTIQSRSCVLVCFNSSLEVINYKVFTSDTKDYFFGTPMVTPSGHILLTSFSEGLNHTYLYRSNEVFNGSVNNLTFQKNDVCSESNHSESCLGYFNDKLVLIIRFEASNAKIMWTDDLEGLTGWSETVQLDYILHAPKLLAYYKGDYLPFVAAWKNSDNGRRAAIGYIKIDTESNNAEIVAIEDVDKSLDLAYNGYSDFVNHGGENYAVTYYQEAALRTADVDDNTGLYYKWINARSVVPQITYLI